MQYSMTDLVKVPSTLGRYTLSWRWDCEQTPQGMAWLLVTMSCVVGVRVCLRGLTAVFWNPFFSMELVRGYCYRLSCGTRERACVCVRDGAHEADG